MQQIAWHKNDFLSMIIALLLAFIWALGVVVRAILGGNHNLSNLYILSCAAYLAVGGCSVARCACVPALPYLPSNYRTCTSDSRGQSCQASTGITPRLRIRPPGACRSGCLFPTYSFLHLSSKMCWLMSSI